MSEIHVNPNTKKRAQLVNAYISGASYTSIFQAYGKPSKAKIYAWFNCVNKCKEYNGFCLYITSHSSHFFTAAFRYLDTEKGKPILVTMTGRNTYFCDYL